MGHSPRAHVQPVDGEADSRIQVCLSSKVSFSLSRALFLGTHVVKSVLFFLMSLYSAEEMKGFSSLSIKCLLYI